ncbi:MAG: AMP phosphorylase [Candidatus Odinarchaeota archaeon]
MVEYTVKLIDILCDYNQVILNEKDAKSLRAAPRGRVQIKSTGKSVLASLLTTKSILKDGEIGVNPRILKALNVKEGDTVEVASAKTPVSLSYIKKKLSGEDLTQAEMTEIVKDIVSLNLSPVEMTAFILAQHYQELSVSEVEYLTRAITETGVTIDFEEPVYDKHSIGGVPGNKVSLLIVPIIASMGLLIPKTSSRAITSPSGTADTFEVLAPVNFQIEEIKSLVKKTRGCLVWGGTLNIAPADDILIETVEYPLSIDPVSQMLASIMSKKLAIGVDSLVLDVPIGANAKVKSKEEAVALSRKFVELGERLKIKVEVGLTYGDQPIGHTIGPALEAKEALEALMGVGTSTSLVEKSTALAGILLEMAGLAARGLGQQIAMECVNSGKALKKMQEIIENQGGDPKIKPEDIPLGEHTEDIPAPFAGYIVEVDNKALNMIAKTAGAPEHKGAGVYLYKKRGGYVKKGDPLLKIYAERSSKLSEAISIANKSNPVTIEGMLLKRVSALY